MSVLIQDSVKARRLARAILLDVALYNQEKLASASDPARDLAPEISEGRALFRTRVATELQALFEEEVAEWNTTVAHNAPKGEVSVEEGERLRTWRTAARNDERRREDSVSERDEEARRKSRVLVWMLVAAALVTAGIVATIAFAAHERHEGHEDTSHHKDEGARH